MMTKHPRWMVWFLALILIWTPLFSAPASYADEGRPPSDDSAVSISNDPVSLTSAAYAAPQNLELVEKTFNSITVKWDPVQDVDPWAIGYWVTIQNEVGSEGKWASGAEPFKLANLQPATRYTITVKVNVGGAEGSEPLVVTTDEDDGSIVYEKAPLAPPSYMKVIAVTADSATLEWGASPEATGYDTYLNGNYHRYEEGTQVTYGSLQVGESYTFMARAQNPSLNPSSSLDSNAVTMIWGELARPQGLQIITATASTVALGWAPTPGATSYDIYQGEEWIGSSSNNRYTVTGLVKDQAYEYRVEAKNSLWSSSISDSITATPGSNYNNITYYTAWSVYARGFQPERVDVSQITHINYAFADLCWKLYSTAGKECSNENIPLQDRYVHDGEMVVGDVEKDLENMSKFVSKRETDSPHLKLMISVGGWSWSKNFSNMARTEETRRTFANSAVNFLRAYDLDGLDIDWEYPVEGGIETNSRGPEDKENFTLLMKTVREALDAAGSEDGKYYLLTIASGQGDNFTVNADFTNSVQYLDFVNIMAYDYSGKSDEMGHHNAPLFYDKNLPRPSAPRNHVLGGLMGHLNGGVPNHKLVVGVPYYGKGWDGCGPIGQYQACNKGGTGFGSWEAAIFDFSDLEDNYIEQNGYKRYWNESAKVAYLYNDQNKVFITYNDENTMKYTASIVKSLDLAGVMSWDISSDRNRTLTTQLVHDLPINGAQNPSALPAPANLSLGSVGAGSIQVKWDEVNGATEYEVYVNNAWNGRASANNFTISGLRASTNYKIHVLAVDRTEDEINRVSSASNQLSVTTSGNSAGGSDGSGETGGSGGSGGSGSTPPPQPPKAENQLEVKVVLTGDKAVVTLPTTAAINRINQSNSFNFQIHAGEGAKQAEIEIPQEVIAAVAKKGAQASLSVIVNGIEYRIPASLISVSGHVKVSIIAPTATEAARVASLLKGKEALNSPLLFKLEQLNADKSTTELKHFGKTYVSEFVTVDANKINTKRAAGVVYISANHELRSVPTLFKTNTDGTVTVEIKKTGNGIYALVQQDIRFLDAIPNWAKEDITQATAQWITAGEREGIFGPGNTMTRAEIIAVIVRALGLLPDDSYSNFADVNAESSYARDIAAAKAAGLVKGRTGNIFDPNSPITREELAVILSNVLDYAGKKNDVSLVSLSKFTDRADISSFAQASVAFMVDQNILKGVSATRLDPKSTVTKAQTVVTVMRMLRTLGLSNE
ncbi:glycosyl hydrolase family 18 protein [Paenibacillus sp. JCM 10914]|uniref:glycosyl hydrolase family 18 protein n=1 Tax=Paenibacillus sp. JCM 10914 TaxID=1236974 RepID=UPI00056A5706|nr:glycosyl hydrolase family 18 protein [Paenibacillus sp. JCM 10914]